jgi:hypothetical protein
MADLEQIYTAIRNADKAGDTESVKKLGAYLQTVQPEAKTEEKPAAWGPPTAWQKFKRDTPYAGSIADALQSEARGVVDPLVGIGQAVAHVVGAGDAADKFVREREASIAQDRATNSDATKRTGTDGFRVMGNFMAPTNYVVPGGAGSNALARIGFAAGRGAAVSATMPVKSGDFLAEKAKQVGLGAVVGGIVGGAANVVGAAVRPVSQAVKSGVDAFKRWLGAEMPSSLQSAAVQKVMEQFGKDEAAGGPKLTEVMDVLNTARATGKPMTLADTGGANVNALAGYVTRQPGEAQSTARALLATRDQGAAARLSKDITENITSGPTMKQTADALTQTRAAAARPLYEEAMKPGSTAPLESQFGAEFGRIQTERAAAQAELAAAERQTTAAAAKASQSGAPPGSPRAIQGANPTAEAAQAKLAALDIQEAKITDVLRESQRAAAAGERGGVWSPRIQQFLDDPIVKAGIGKGLQVQRLEALAEGRPFDPKDFAVTGMGQDGEPVVSKVPNMRLLDSAKRGLDEILEGYRDKTTGRLVLDQRGRAIDQVRQAFVGELDRLNPAYKAARASWSGPSQSIDAMKAGADIFNRSPEEVAERFARLSPNDKEFYRLGVADKLRERIAKTGVGGDEAKAIIKNNWTQSQLRPIFDSQEHFNRFIDAATTESKMFDTAFRLKGGSHTAERLAADHQFGPEVEAATHGAGAAHNALSGRFISAARDMWRMRQALGWRKNEALNAEIAKVLFDPSVTRESLQSGAGQRLLESFPGPVTQNYLAHMTRQRLQQLAPAAGAIAPTLLNPGPSQ